MIPHELLGTIPGWITAGGMVAILGVVLRYRLGWRKLDVEARTVQINAQTVREADIRDHYAEALERVNTLLEGCRRQCDEYRREIVVLDKKLTGVVRQFVAFQLETAKAIPPENVSPEMQKMLISLDILAKGNGK